jgi:hypothetical protein
VDAPKEGSDTLGSDGTAGTAGALDTAGSTAFWMAAPADAAAAAQAHKQIKTLKS